MVSKRSLTGLGIILALSLLTGCGDADQFESQQKNDPAANFVDDGEPDLFDDSFVAPFACVKATSSQIAVVNQGNLKKDAFLEQCALATAGSPWCNQLVRPNPDSISTFRCTYGTNQMHQLIHPNENTWKHAFNAVKLIQELEQKGFRIKIVYNWWRPEPYNKNVGGAAGRHPMGTSVDVRFVTNSQADQAFLELCKYRKQGRVRAIGHYGTNALHFGIGDSTGNTWGKSCP